MGGKGKGKDGSSCKGGGYRDDSARAKGSDAYQGGSKGGFKTGGKSKHYGDVACSSPPALRTEPGTGIAWNPADRDDTWVFLGRPFVRGRRMASHTKWCGIRATKGLASGRGAFAVKNETGGNMRVGWSLESATLELGMDEKSFGFGGTAMKSHGGKYQKFGQTYGEGDVVVALIDLDRHAMHYMKNEHEIPGDAYKIPRELWGSPFFPHLLTKEATVTTYFGGASLPFKLPSLPLGFQWLSDLPLVASAQQCNHDEVEYEACDAIVEVDASKLEQAAHRTQFETWKINVNDYAKHFQRSLAWEYEAERQSVMQRIKRGIRQLESTGYGCSSLFAELLDTRVRLTRSRGIPRLAEISVGRTVLITNEDTIPALDNPRISIWGEVHTITEHSIIVATTYDGLPDGTGLFRIDLGPNMSTYERIDRVLDRLQSCEAPSKKIKNRMGIMSPCTPLGDSLFDAVAEFSGAAQRWDPSTRPKPNPESDVSRAARQPHISVPTRAAVGQVPDEKRLNGSQAAGVAMVLQEARRLTLIQGPPGTGKTTTAIEIICNWLRSRSGPVLATAFSNKGVDNLADGLLKRGVNVLRVGICDAEMPYSMEAHLEWYGHACRKGAGKGEQNDVIRKADVVCATVIGSGMALLRSFDFPFVVLDEAAQIIEPACLIPLSKGSVQVVMVGDQCQLPATVLSHQAQQAGLDVSLFDRLISMGMEVHMLSIQYRMHPLIAEFPSWRFYNHNLETGVRPDERPPVELRGLPALGTMAVIHVGAAENAQGMSKSNSTEAECVSYLVRALSATQPLGDVGVITPYSAQVAAIRQAIRSACSQADQLQVSSVDAFQGSEKETIVLSMVRSNLRGDIGFVADWRRLNVAATRAKRLLVVVGNLVTLSQHALWRDFFGFHQDLKVLEWNAGRFNPLSVEPSRLLAAAREISRRRGVKPLPLRGDYPVDTDFASVERGELTWDAPSPLASAGDLSWDVPLSDGTAWDMPAPVACVGDWDAGAAWADFDNSERTLTVGRNGALLDLEPTRWGMRVEGVDKESENHFEVGSIIVSIEGNPLTQEDNSEESLDRVEGIFGNSFADGASIRLEPQEELLVGWGNAPQGINELAENLDLIIEACPQGLLVYGPRQALDLARTAFANAA